MFRLVRKSVNPTQRIIYQRHLNNQNKKNHYALSLSDNVTNNYVVRSLSVGADKDSTISSSTTETTSAKSADQTGNHKSLPVFANQQQQQKRYKKYSTKDDAKDILHQVMMEYSLHGHLSSATRASSYSLFRSSLASLNQHYYFDNHCSNNMHHYQHQQYMYFSSSPPGGSHFSTAAKIPTPKHHNKEEPAVDIKKLQKGAQNIVISTIKAVITFLIKTPGNIIYYLTHPTERREKIAEIKEIAKKEFDHYWMGTKLLMADVRTARKLFGKTLSGSALTRRERKQLLRTVSDLFRLVPFSMFVIIPFMEFALPFALRLFPNMLPSTFQDSLKAEENMKRELQSRIAMAQFFQETLEELAKEQKRIAEKKRKQSPGSSSTGGDGESEDEAIARGQEQSAASMLEFLEKARRGEILPNDVIIQYAHYFQDDLTLDNMPRMQLINMCKYMSIPPYGADSFLRFQLRHRMRSLKEDDQRILWEGIDSLTKMELREACQERGMRSTGLSKEAYRRALQQWLDLSVNKNVPIALLIMSRTFFLQEEILTPSKGGSSDEDKSVASLVDAISGLDKEVLNEVLLEVATMEEKASDPDVRKIKLEVLTQQNEKIQAEQAERDAAAKKKEAKEKQEKEQGKVAESSTPPEQEQQQQAPPNLEAPATESPTPVAASTGVSSTPSATDAVVTQATADAVASSTLEADEKATEAKEADDSPADEVFAQEYDLSTEEMEAISQLVSADPVSKERAELERIKAAMQKGEKDKEEAKKELLKVIAAATPVTGGDTVTADATATSPAATDTFAPSTIDADQKAAPAAETTSMPTDETASKIIADMEKKAAAEAEQATTFTTESEIPASATGGDKAATADESEQKEEGKDLKEEEKKGDDDDDEDDVPEDPVIARLKQRIASMVDKIEVQLTDAEKKIGDKLHILDKDMDGIMTKDEVATAIRMALKREISMEEAHEICDAMDENKDGVFTVQELSRWIETNKLLRLEEEGRDADMDRIMESVVASSSSSENQKEEAKEGIEEKVKV